MSKHATNGEKLLSGIKRGKKQKPATTSEKFAAQTFSAANFVRLQGQLFNYEEYSRYE